MPVACRGYGTSEPPVEGAYSRQLIVVVKPLSHSKCGYSTGGLSRHVTTSRQNVPHLAQRLDSVHKSSGISRSYKPFEPRQGKPRQPNKP